MDVETLRAAQRPLKEKYTADPRSAITPLRASADFRDGGITATVDSWGGPVRAGLHTATGGDGSDACSGDMLLQALLGCTGVTLRSVATAMRIEIRDASLTATGHFDARGTCGLDATAPVGVQNIVVTAELDTDADDDRLAKLAAATERYCVVAQSLREPIRLEIIRRRG